MLIGIDPILTADLLHALKSMGHNDTIVIADRNFPASSLAQRYLPLSGVDAPRVAKAILSVMPLDEGPNPASAMKTAAADGRDAVTKELEQVVGQPLSLLAPPDFYAEATKAYMIVQSGEPRFYGNLILRKGVLPPQ